MFGIADKCYCTRKMRVLTHVTPMKPIYVPLLILFFSTKSFAQQSVLLEIHGYGADKTDRIEKHVVYTEDKGVIVKIPSALGNGGNLPKCHNGVNFYENIFRKYDSTGTIVWEKCYRPGAFQTDTAILYLYPAENGDFYTLGLYGTGGPSGGNVKYFLSKEDNNQNILWRGPGYGDINQLTLRAVSRSDDGGFFLAFQSLFAGGDIAVHYGSAVWLDVWVLKLDSLGNKLWSKTIGGSYDDVVQAVVPTIGGGCILAGGTGSNDYELTGSHGGSEIFVVKLDSNGNIKWNKLIGGAFDEWCYDACSNGNEGVLIGGQAMSKDGDVLDHLGQIGSVNPFVANIDSSGNLLWGKCYGIGGNVKALAKSVDGSIWLTGESIISGRHTDTAFGDGDAWVARISDSGQFISSIVLGSTKEDEGKMICTLSGGVAMVGGEYKGPGIPPNIFPSNYFGGPTDIFVAKLAPWTTSVETLPPIKYTLAPNPATKTLTIEVSKRPSELFFVTLINQSGSNVLEKSTWNGAVARIDISSLPKGSYVLVLEQRGKRSVNEKILIQ